MTVPLEQSPRGSRRLSQRTVSSVPRLSARAGLGLVGLGLVTGTWVGCGGSDEDDGADVPGFTGGLANPPTNSAAPTPAASNNPTSSVPCTPGSVGCASPTPEVTNPSIPVDQTSNMAQTGSTACAPNTSSCSGSLLNRCDGAGLPMAPRDCAATPGGSCGQVGGVPSCVEPACSPGVAACETANTISTCAADGSASSVTRCPDGTNCTGAGQCTPVRCDPSKLLSSNSGGVTVYWFNQGTYSDVRRPEEDINCSFGSDGSQQGTGQEDRVFNIPDERLFGAINGTDYGDSAACGACAELRNAQNNRTVTITVVDSCLVGNNNPTCTRGHIDLSRAAFEQLTGQTTGDINNITWRFVPCAGDDKVQFLLKKPDDQYWNQFIVLNHPYPIVRAEVEMEPGRWVDARRETYNYWLPPEGDGGQGGDMGTYRVRVTDINGAIIEEQLELRAGPQGGSGQFACQ